MTIHNLEYLFIKTIINNDLINQPIIDIIYINFTQNGGNKMNNVIVAKFGGSSLADADQFRKVHSIICSDQRRRYIVPSAPGKRSKDDTKITDLLYKCHDCVQKGISVEDTFDIIFQRYMEIARELSVNLDIQTYLSEVKKNILSGESRDYAASRGEYLNGLILAGYLGYEFVDAAEVIFFDESGHFNSERTQEVMSKRLSGLEKAVIPGFYGSLPDGRVKTFSRGGSDITGAIVARGVNADLYENWTDVSGFLMTDPRIVENPKTIDRITYRELRELAYMGATVLHDESIFPVKQAGIPVNIKNTNEPGDAGTLIVSDSVDAGEAGNITGIAGKKGFTVIHVEKSMMNTEIGFARKLLSIMEDLGVIVEHMPTGIDTICLVVLNSQLEGKIEKIVEQIKIQCSPDVVMVHPEVALIAVVGRGMVRAKGVAARVFNSLAEDEISIKIIDQGSSEMNIILGVENDDFEKAIKAIYRAFEK